MSGRHLYSKAMLTNKILYADLLKYGILGFSLIIFAEYLPNSISKDEFRDEEDYYLDKIWKHPHYNILKRSRG